MKNLLLLLSVFLALPLYGQDEAGNAANIDSNETLTVDKRESKPSIRVPDFKQISNLRDLYRTDGTPQVLLVLHLPKGQGKAFVEVYNHTGRDLSIFQFSLNVLGQLGDLSFEDIPSGWSGVKETELFDINELMILSPRAIDDKANEFFPKLVVHYEIGKIKPLKTGKRKI